MKWPVVFMIMLILMLSILYAARELEKTPKVMTVKFNTTNGETVTVEVPKKVKKDQLKEAEKIMKEYFPDLIIKSKQIL